MLTGVSCQKRLNIKREIAMKLDEKKDEKIKKADMTNEDTQKVTENDEIMNIHCMTKVSEKYLVMGSLVKLLLEEKISYQNG